jgi:hypothetical protein
MTWLYHRESKAEAYYAYAEELRAIAAQMSLGAARSQLLRVADEFDGMAGAAEIVARSQARLKKPNGSALPQA